MLFGQSFSESLSFLGVIICQRKAIPNQLRLKKESINAQLIKKVYATEKDYEKHCEEKHTKK
jgi:hypothetical protein